MIGGARGCAGPGVGYSSRSGSSRVMRSPSWTSAVFAICRRMAQESRRRVSADQNPPPSPSGSCNRFTVQAAKRSHGRDPAVRVFRRDRLGLDGRNGAPLGMVRRRRGDLQGPCRTRAGLRIHRQRSLHSLRRRRSIREGVGSRRRPADRGILGAGASGVGNPAARNRIVRGRRPPRQVPPIELLGPAASLV